jgi:hypothetical protein
MIRRQVIPLMLSMSVLSCSSAGLIDRTQPNALDKSNFDGIWYHRAMVVESDPESGYIEGISSNMDKIRWDITENMLIAYRSYEFVAFAEGLTEEEKDFYGSPVAAFPIESHFDIQRDFNATTGVENNVVIENDTDRPWNERRYMRVDWSENQVGTPTRFRTGWSNFPDGFFSGTALSSFYVQAHESDNPHRPVFTKDYFDVTNVYHLEPSRRFCTLMLLYNGVPRCGAADVKVRLAFRRVMADDDYEPLYYPDNVEVKNGEGDAVVLNFEGRPCDENTNPGDCEVQTFPYDAQFGNFRIQRPAVDRERFLTRSGRVYMAGRFDLWDRSFDDATGEPIPYSERAPKPIVFYGNPGFPRDFVSPAQRLTASWSEPLNETVAMLQGRFRPDGGPDAEGLRAAIGQDMFQFRENDCRPENILDYAERNDLMGVVEAVAGNKESVARGNVERVCAAVQFEELRRGKTLDPKRAAQEPGIEMAFTWQRKGDLRYSMQNYIETVHGGPWGVAQFGQDPETGEFVANVANYFGATGDIVAQREVDLIQWLNGDIDEETLLRGDVTRQEVVSRKTAKETAIRQQVRELIQKKELDLLAGDPRRIFVSESPSADADRMRDMWSGTELEREYLVNEELLRGFAGPTMYQPFNSFPRTGAPFGITDESLASVVPGSGSDDAMSAAGPMSWAQGSSENPFMEAAYEFGQRAFDMMDFFDPNTQGLAETMKGRSREEIYEFLRHELYASVQGHEVGHALGLRHNFQASMDPINYRNEFWSDEVDGQVREYWQETPDPEAPSRGAEYKYASLMDYAFDVSIEGLHGIGPYDKAAIRFMYGQLVDVWDDRKFSIPDPRKYGTWAARCGFDSNFYGLPALLSWMSPELYPRLFSSTPKNQEFCADNYDNNTACDSPMDSLYRNLVSQTEANGNSIGDKSHCTAYTSTFNALISEIRRLPANAKNISEARRIVPVNLLLDQQRSMLNNPPEYDNPGTVVDETRDGLDSDGDGNSDDKGFDWSTFQHRVEYGYCSDLYANYSNPFCQRWDAGWDFEEAVDNHINWYDRQYVFDHFRRDQFQPGGWYSPGAYMARLQARRLYHMTNVFRYYLFSRSSSFEPPIYASWAEAAYKGINFLERIIQTPEPGRYCLDRAGNRYVPDNGGACEAALDVPLGFGGGRYFDTSWSDEYFYKANRIGVFYDKLAAIQQLTSSSGFFVRDLSDLFDRRAYSLGYLRVYLDPMLQRFGSIISGQSDGYRPRVVEDLVNNDRYVRYMPLFDEAREDGRSVREWLEPKPSIEPSSSYTLRYVALAFALGNWSSINDNAPEFFRFTKISIRGAPEDVAYGPGITVAEFTDPETLLTYRAPRIEPLDSGSLIQEFPAYYGDAFYRARNEYRPWGVGAALLEEAKTFLTAEWRPAETACTGGTAGRWGTPEAACVAFRQARERLREKIGFIETVRKFSNRAEAPFGR